MPAAKSWSMIARTAELISGPGARKPPRFRDRFLRRPSRPAPGKKRGMGWFLCCLPQPPDTGHRRPHPPVVGVFFSRASKRSCHLSTKRSPMYERPWPRIVRSGGIRNGDFESEIRDRWAICSMWYAVCRANVQPLTLSPTYYILPTTYQLPRKLITASGRQLDSSSFHWLVFPGSA